MSNLKQATSGLRRHPSSGHGTVTALCMLVCASLCVWPAGVPDYA